MRAASRRYAMERLTRDLRYVFRALRRTPLFTAGVVTTLALTIGSSVALFAVVDTLLIQPLPFRDPETLVWIASESPGRRDSPFTVAEYLDYWRDGPGVQSLLAFANWSAILSGDGPADR